jgi:23S rRNA (uridine2552-2'-O)-methyltransferase
MSPRKRKGAAADPLSGRRAETVRVKTAKKRSVSSARWLARQLNDPYVAAAKAQGMRSRAAFKLTEIDDRFHFLKPGARVVDLGAAPGGWSQIAAERVGVAKGRGKVVALDILPMAPMKDVAILEADMNDAATPERLRAVLQGPADVVLSDMAAPTTGDRATDHLRVVQLCEAAFAFAFEVLAPGGAIVSKVFQGGTEKKLLDQLKQRFVSVRHVKPKASRAESPEVYVVAMGFKAKGL